LAESFKETFSYFSDGKIIKKKQLYDYFNKNPDYQNYFEDFEDNIGHNYYLDNQLLNYIVKNIDKLI